MLQHNPVLKERLTALGVFSGIAIAGVAGFELVISGSLDFITPGGQIREVAPSSYVRVVQEPWVQQTRYVPLTSSEPLFAGGEVERPAAELAGGWSDASAPDGVYSELPSEADLYAEIDALYVAADEPRYNVQTASDDEPYVLYVDEAPKPNQPDAFEVSAYESASPW
jgi:hypothetical protein